MNALCEGGEAHCNGSVRGRAGVPWHAFGSGSGAGAAAAVGYVISAVHDSPESRSSLR
jgi:hypothetical protein